MASHARAIGVWLVAGLFGGVILIGGFDTSLRRSGQAARAMVFWPSAETRSVYAENLYNAGDFAGARKLALEALDQNPSDVRAMRTLGLSDLALGRDQQGLALMNAAVKGGWRDSPTQLWLIQQALAVGDFETVIQRIDAMLRRDQAVDSLLSALRLIIASREARSALVERFADAPDWRGLFFLSLRHEKPEEIQSIGALIGEMAGTPTPLTANESFAIVERLIELGDFMQARRIWQIAARRGSGTGQQFVDDPDFQRLAHRPPDYVNVPRFEWQMSPAASLDTRRNGHGVAVRLSRDDTGTDVPPLWQILTLPPGRYAWAIRYAGDGNFETLGFVAKIECIPDRGGISTLTADRQGGRAVPNIAFYTILVPKDCAAQRLSIDRTPLPGSAGTTLWINSVAITPAR